MQVFDVAATCHTFAREFRFQMAGTLLRRVLSQLPVLVATVSFLSVVQGLSSFLLPPTAWILSQFVVGVIPVL
jgi:hypothetical protein